MAQRFGVLYLFFATLLTIVLCDQNVSYSSYVMDGPDPSNQIYAVAVNVPSPAISDDLYFAFRGPSAPSWVAFGFGSAGQQMSGALIFVAYLGEDGKSITVSPRLGTGHVQPQYTSDVKITVNTSTTYYDSSTDESGGYFVDFHCTNCRSWAGGSGIDITSTEQAMIWAMGPSGEVKSDDLDATIQQHTGTYGGFTLDLQQATGLGGSPASGDLESSSGSSGSGHSGRSISTGLHALLMIGGFLVVLPAGYLALRIFDRVWMHWGIQSFGLFVIVLGSVAGIAISKRDQISPSLTSPHQIIGLVALFLMLITWTAGLLGHLHFRRTKMSRSTIPQKSHRILGPLTVTVGLVNGILGFRFAGNTRAIIGYIVVVTLMLIFVSLLMMMNKRRAQRKNAMMTPAAQNFRMGQAENAYVPNPQQDEAAVPLRDYGRTEYTGAGGDIGEARPPPVYSEAGDYYAPPPGRPT